MRKSNSPKAKSSGRGYKALAQKYARQLEVIEEVNRIINPKEQTESALHAALEYVLQSFDYPAAQVYRLSPTGSDLWLYLELGSGTKPVSQNHDIFGAKDILDIAIKK